MRKGNLLFSAIQFLMIVALFFVGAVFLGLHFLPNARILCAEWLMDARREFLLLGGLTTGMALFLTICFAMMQRGQYVRIAMQSGLFDIQKTAIKQAVNQYWQESFPEKPLPTEIYVSRQKIEIITKEASYNLNELEAALGERFAAQFGYKHSFFITLKN